MTVHQMFIPFFPYKAQFYPIFFMLSGMMLIWGCAGENVKGADSDDASSDVEDTGKDTGSDTSGTQGTPTQVASGEFTYLLSESTDDFPIWTTPVTHKLVLDSRPPASVKSGISLSAARNEFESVQLVLGPCDGSASVTFSGFDNLDGQRGQLAKAEYTSGWVETLRPLASGDVISLSADAPTPVWLTVFVPKTATPGTHEGRMTVTRNGLTVDVPVNLYVFDFDLPDDIHFATQLNISIQSLMGEKTASEVKTMLFEHRMTPKSVTWPSGFNWGITWDNASAPAQCEQFYDEPDEGDAYAIGALAPKYILGEGWNGVGFPNAMLFQFVDNSTPRPALFCGVSRGDHFGTDAYNREWSAWLSALNSYLVSHGMADKAYYYVQNEPQNADDEALAAHLCRLTRAAAPNLRIAVSEEPKPSIAEDAAGACGYDIWIAHVRAYQQDYAWQRQATHGEAVWFYSLDHDPPPYFNPTTVESQGMNQRIIPWAAFSHRITGWAYYDAGRFFDDSGNPGVRAALLREGFEDYEYLWLANGGAHPAVNEAVPVDATVTSVAASMVSWTTDADALMAVRHQLGLYIEGTVDTLPVLEVESSRPLGNYFINFQDPLGEPAVSPLIVDGKEYMKIGWNEYNADMGYGWQGEFMGNNSILLSGYSSADGFNDIQRSYIYDDYGRDNLFEFDLSPGTYTITVGVGMAGRAYEGQPHNVSIEGVQIIDDEPTTPSETLIEKTVTMDITDGALSLVAAGKSEAINDYSYTFVAYLEIEWIE